MKIERMMLGMVQTNCYLLYEEELGEVICVDPADNGKEIYERLKEKGLSVAAIFLTHGHFDHILGAAELRRLSGAKVYACEKEKAICEDSAQNASAMIGLPVAVCADVYVKDKEVLETAGIRAQVIATPGHTAGSCCYYFEKEGVLMSGDTLFQGSVGRSDFPTGNGRELIRSIKEKLLVLPEDTAVYPGHGGGSSIGEEKRGNPFL